MMSDITWFVIGAISGATLVIVWVALVVVPRVEGLIDGSKLLRAEVEHIRGELNQRNNNG